jgi:hypothetical protein
MLEHVKKAAEEVGDAIGSGASAVAHEAEAAIEVVEGVGNRAVSAGYHMAAGYEYARGHEEDAAALQETGNDYGRAEQDHYTAAENELREAGRELVGE